MNNFPLSFQNGLKERVEKAPIIDRRVMMTASSIARQKNMNQIDLPCLTEAIIKIHFEEDVSKAARTAICENLENLTETGLWYAQKRAKDRAYMYADKINYHTLIIGSDITEGIRVTSRK